MALRGIAVVTATYPRVLGVSGPTGRKVERFCKAAQFFMGNRSSKVLRREGRGGGELGM